LLRRRIITFLTFNNGVLFRTKNFVPDYRYTANFIDTWSVDEIVIVDISKEKKDKRNFLKVINNFARNCFVPITVGGGIKSVDDARSFLSAGADRVVVSTGIVESPELISEISNFFGAQCLVAAIDIKLHSQQYKIYIENGKKKTDLNLIQWIKKIEKNGAGELLINSIDKDGSLSGYDIKICKEVSKKVKIPIVIAGGCGNWNHFYEGIKIGGADAVSTNNIYHFTERSIKNAKNYLKKRGILIR